MLKNTPPYCTKLIILCTSEYRKRGMNFLEKTREPETVQSARHDIRTETDGQGHSIRKNEKRTCGRYGTCLHPAIDTTKKKGARKKAGSQNEKKETLPNFAT